MTQTPDRPFDKIITDALWDKKDRTPTKKLKEIILRMPKLQPGQYQYLMKELKGLINRKRNYES